MPPHLCDFCRLDCGCPSNFSRAHCSRVSLRNGPGCCYGLIDFGTSLCLPTNRTGGFRHTLLGHIQSLRAWSVSVRRERQLLLMHLPVPLLWCLQCCNSGTHSSHYTPSSSMRPTSLSVQLPCHESQLHICCVRGMTGVRGVFALRLQRLVARLLLF